MKRKILLGLTTTPKSDWRGKVEEINKFKIKEAALFPTMLGLTEREELYKLLEKSCVEEIPHVHLRDDMKNWELDYFYKKYKTRLFNIHLTKEANNFIDKNKTHLKKIFVENGFDAGKGYFCLLKKVAGVCLDVAHYHDLGILQKIPTYAGFSEILKKYPIGCCHVSAIRERPKSYNKWDIRDPSVKKIYGFHLLGDLSELDYVKNYVRYLPEYISIELENSFKDKIKAKKYLEKIIN